MALQSTETHNITMKNLALFRPKLRDSYSTNQMARRDDYVKDGGKELFTKMHCVVNTNP